MTIELHRTVPGSGPLNADILLIAEAPGATEEFGIPPNVPLQPLIGKAGLFMQQMCSQAGLSWAHIRKDNVVQRRPFPNSNEFKLAFYTQLNPLSQAKNAKLIPTDELLAWRADVHKRVLLTKPKIIIAAGGEALRALTQWDSDTQWRGSVIEYQSPLDADFTCYLIPIVHPSFAQKCYHNTSSKQKEVRQPWFNITVSDLKKARRILEQGWNPHPRLEHIFPTFHEVLTYLEELKQMPPTTLITLDIETQGQKAKKGEESNETRIGCLGLSHTHSSAFCIPFIIDTWGNSYFSMDEEAQVLRAIQLALKGKRLVGQFVGFDVAWLDREFGLNLFDDVFIDTAVLHSLLFPELHHSLAFLVSTLTDLPYYKYLGRQDEKVRSFEEWFSYNCQDVYSTHEIAELLIKEAKRVGMWDYYLNKTLPILKWTFYQHKRGLWIDEEARECLLEVFLNETLLPMQRVLDEALEEVGYGAINPKSPPQVKALLKDMDFSVESTDKEALQELIDLTGSSIIKTILELRKGYSAVGRLSKPAHEDGQYRTALSMHVTETGRLASRASHFGGGDNLQNVNEKLRPIFRARPGYMLLEADLGAAEARMVAWYAGDPGLKEAFIKNLDVHTHRASMIYEMDYEVLLTEVQEDEENKRKNKKRQCGKVCVHSVGYDIGIRTLRKTLMIHGVHMMEKEVKNLRRRIHQRFPGILYYQQGVQQKLNQTRTLTTARGRRRYFFSKLDPNTYRRGYAFLPQATVGEVANDGIVLLLKNEEFQFYKAAILLQVHDSLLVEVPEEFAIPCLHLIKGALETPTLITPFHGLADVLTVPVDLKIGTNWGALEKITL